MGRGTKLLIFGVCVCLCVCLCVCVCVCVLLLSFPSLPLSLFPLASPSNLFSFSYFPSSTASFYRECLSVHLSTDRFSTNRLSQLLLLLLLLLFLILLPLLVYYNYIIFINI